MNKSEGKIISIDKKTAKTMVDKYHYLAAKGFRFGNGFGLEVGNELVGAAVFHSVSAPETVVGAFGLARTEQEGIWELGRLVMNPSFNGGNWTSFLLGRSLRLMRQGGAKAIITYASSDRHSGGIYRACNFTYCGMTTKKKDFTVNGKIQERGKTKGVEGVWVDRPRKHRYILIFDKELQKRFKWKIEKFICLPKNSVTSYPT